MTKKLINYDNFLIAVLMGIATGYLACSLIHVTIRPIILPKPKFNDNNTKKYNIAYDVIYMANIFNVETGNKDANIQKTIKPQKIITKVIQELEGYKLIGYIGGDNPIVLLKKGDSPVEIITKTKGLKDAWILDSIKKEGIYIKNKNSGEMRLFQFEKETSIDSSLKNKTSLNVKRTYVSTVKKVSVNREVLNRAADINSMLKTIRVGPYFKNGKPMGYKINYLKKSSILTKIGLKRGDIIVSINGEPTTDPNAIMKLYSQMNDLNSVTLDIIRDNQKKTLFVDIK